MLTLYLAPGSSSMAAHIALHEVGCEARLHPVSLARRETQSPAFLAVSPEGKVPVLLIDGRRLTEVAGILVYLARRFPEAGLLPAGDPEAEAQAISWMSFLASRVHPARALGPEPARAAWALAEARLGAGPWALGAAYSVADIHLFRLFWRFRGGLGLQPGAFPTLVAHHDRMMARPAVRRTLEAEAAMGYELPA